MKQIAQFIKEVRIELTKVEWPKTNEWIGATIVTLILVVFFSIFLGLVDGVNRWIIYDKIFSHVRK